MLVLQRVPGEYLKIGDDILIKVVMSDGRKVKIGIEAPKELSVQRLNEFYICESGPNKGTVQWPDTTG